MDSRRNRDADNLANQGRLQDSESIRVRDDTKRDSIGGLLNTSNTTEAQAPFAASPNLQTQPPTPTDHDLAICQQAKVKKRPSRHPAPHLQLSSCPTPLFTSIALARIYTLYLAVINPPSPIAHSERTLGRPSTGEHRCHGATPRNERISEELRTTRLQP